MQKDFKNIPLSKSNVSLKLADIQKRCTELIEEPCNTLELSLEDPVGTPDNGTNPYDRG